MGHLASRPRKGASQLRFVQFNCAEKASKGFLLRSRERIRQHVRRSFQNKAAALALAGRNTAAVTTREFMGLPQPDTTREGEAREQRTICRENTPSDKHPPYRRWGDSQGKSPAGSRGSRSGA